MAALKAPGTVAHAGASPLARGIPKRNDVPPRGAPGVTSSKSALTPYEQDLILKTAGRNMDGTPFSLPLLEASRARHRHGYQEASREFGAGSVAARFEQVTIDRLTELIEQARKEAAGEASIQQLHEKAPGERERRKAEIRLMITGYKQPRRIFTLVQLGGAVTRLAEIERQMELAGMEGDLEVMALWREVAVLAGEQYKEDVRRVLADFQRPGSGVTPEQVGAQVVNLLGNQRQQQLAGIEADQEAWDLYLQARELVNPR
jgi:hypothetical protein